MDRKTEKDAHIWERDPDDWYVEPVECSLALLKTMNFEGKIWDPAVGGGNIGKSAELCRLQFVGSDVVKRSSYCDFEASFMEIEIPPKFTHIVSNPPFGVAEKFVLKALDLPDEGQSASMLLPLVWMAGFSKKRDWLPNSPLSCVLPMSPRPSMPPGKVIEAGIKPGNGTKDFAWFVWTKGYMGPPTLSFLNTSPYKGRKNKPLVQGDLGI